MYFYACIHETSAPFTEIDRQSGLRQLDELVMRNELISCFFLFLEILLAFDSYKFNRMNQNMHLNMCNPLKYYGKVFFNLEERTGDSIRKSIPECTCKIINVGEHYEIHGFKSLPHQTCLHSYRYMYLVWQRIFLGISYYYYLLTTTNDQLSIFSDVTDIISSMHQL